MSLGPAHLDPATWLVAGGRPSGAGRPTNHPIVAASTFEHGADRVYSRNDATAAWEALEEVLGGLERGEAVVFGSGMAAASAMLDQLPVGARIVLPDGCYHGVSQAAQGGADAGRWTVDVLPMDDTAAWVAARASADLVWAESPTNPLLTVADLRAIGAAERPTSGLFVVDNTLATALRQQPLDLGADVVLQSTTKFIGGHSDLLGGVLTTRSADLAAAFRTSRSVLGSTPGALETFLALRGVRTMAMRLETAETSAAVLSERLAAHDSVLTTRYPGLGAMVSFDVANAATADAVCERLQVIRHATSLGGVESLIERRSRYSDSVPAGLLRLSVGCEHVEDLWADLDRALSGSTATSTPPTTA
ncbi:MAG: aminotransferase class I/II-fold pyridoxal phosphate-dependent enzyme [Actinomycetota bacterium]